PRRPGHPGGDQALHRLADHPAALSQGPVRRRLRHRDRDVPVRRALQALRQAAFVIRYAVVGLGHIARGAVLPAFARAPGSTLAALVSRDPEKLADAARLHPDARPVLFGDLDALLETGAIDAVYLAVPNPLHADLAVRALERRVHVLCEKPLALRVVDCQRMI